MHDGEVVLEGTMGNYLLKGNGGATLPDVGNVPVALDVVLKRKNIFVNQAEVSALGGSLRNTGTLHLGDAIFWEGETQLTEISATDFPLDCFLVPSTNLFTKFLVNFGAFNFVHGSFKAGPNCSNIWLIPEFPPAR